MLAVRSFQRLAGSPAVSHMVRHRMTRGLADEAKQATEKIVVETPKGIQEAGQKSVPKPGEYSIVYTVGGEKHKIDIVVRPGRWQRRLKRLAILAAGIAVVGGAGRLMGDRWEKKIQEDPQMKALWDRNKRITAYHEAGHALVAYYTTDAPPIKKASVKSWGPALGHVSFQFPRSKWLMLQTKSQLLAQMDIAMAGRVAEEMVFGPDNITKGASMDLRMANNVASCMVTEYGMSKKLGLQVLVGGPFGTMAATPETRQTVEQEVRKLLQESYDRASRMLRLYRVEHERLALALLEHHSLSAEEVKMVLRGEELKHKKKDKEE
ncbi:hypothetical protein Bbelb_079580 [Branchiostoma belcheri]|nr:hypothetical protein Bbelb_079580 [Branchiostoma belcheri]